MGLNPSLFAQNRITDSLLVLLNDSELDSNRVKLYNDLSWEYFQIDVEKCLYYADEACCLAELLNYPKGKSRAFNLMALGVDLQGNPLESYRLNQESYKIAEQIKDKYLMGSALNDLGIYFSNAGNQEEAIKHYRRSLLLTREAKDTLGLAYVLLNMSISHDILGNEEEAERYLRESTAIGESSNDSKTKVLVLSNLGYSLIQKEEYGKAQEKFSAALEIAREYQYRWDEIQILMGLAVASSRLGHIELALQHDFAALKLAKENNMKLAEMWVYEDLAGTYHDEKDFPRAIESAEMALSLALTMRQIDTELYLYDYLARLNKESKNFEQAYTYLESANELKDSLHTLEQEKRVAELEISYEGKQREVENQLLRVEARENAIVLDKRKTILNLAGMVLGLISLLAIFLFFAYREKNRFNQKLQKEVEDRTVDLKQTIDQLERSNQELEGFAYIASHDLKEPVRNIGSFTNLASRSLQGGKVKEVEEYLCFVKESAEQMYLLIEDVLEFSRVDKVEVESRSVDLMDIVQKIESTLRPMLDDQQAIIARKHLPVVKGDPTQLFILLKNLIENGLKYNQSKRAKVSIRFVADPAGAYHKVIVSDNGIGIPEEYQEQIFGMFKRLHNRSEYKGSGLGLSICKKIMKTMQGDIRLLSTPGEGSTFVLSIPHDRVESLPNASPSAERKVAVDS